MKVESVKRTKKEEKALLQKAKQAGKRLVFLSPH